MDRPTCVIVGAGAGLGLSIARKFAARGYSIAMIARRSALLAEHARELRTDGLDVRGFPADAGNPDELARAFEQIRSWERRIEVLIYNVAAMQPDFAADLTIDEMQASMRVNLLGAIASVSHVLPDMRRNGSGSILITGGGLALEPYPDWTALAAGKSALRSYALSLHKALADDNIYVAVIAVCGIVQLGGDFDADRVAEVYWELHAAKQSGWHRESVYLPPGADPFYNDPDGVYRDLSRPVGFVG